MDAIRETGRTRARENTFRRVLATVQLHLLEGGLSLPTALSKEQHRRRPESDNLDLWKWKDHAPTLREELLLALNNAVLKMPRQYE